MKATIESAAHSTSSPQADKAALLKGFEQFLEGLTQPLLAELAKGGMEDRYFDALQQTLSAAAPPKASIKVRNQMAYAKGKALAFENIKSAYELLDSRTVCELLNITRQALNKKVQSGQVLAYTHGARKYYPSFQFERNTVMREIGMFTEAVSVDCKEGDALNGLLGFLAQAMDYANPGEPENSQPRYKLLGSRDAWAIIVRDFNNRLSMGK